MRKLNSINRSFLIICSGTVFKSKCIASFVYFFFSDLLCRTDKNVVLFL